MPDIPSSPRVNKSIYTARAFIQYYGIDRLPVNPLRMIEQNNDWEIRTLREILAIKPSYVMDSQDAEILYFEGQGGTDKYLIIYNDEIQPQERIKWTIMHEIAHIALGHLKEFEQTKISRNSLSNRERKVLEREADIFTAEVMAPLSLLKALDVSHYSEVIRYCHLSKVAAENRIKDIHWHGLKSIYSKSDVFYFKQFHQYLRRMKVNIQRKKGFRHAFPLLSNAVDEFFIFETTNYFSQVTHCSHCGNRDLTKFSIFCPICSEPIKSTTQGGRPLYYRRIEIDEYGKVSVCPRCKNEDIEGKATYCKICGASLYQSCTNSTFDSDGISECDNQPAGNARYCEVCGAETTFLREGLLSNWQYEKEELEEDLIPF